MSIILTAPFLFFVLIGLLIERFRPAEVQPANSIRFNIAYTFLYSIGQSALSPLSLGLVSAVVGLFGGGLIVLPSSGWLLLPGFLLFAVVMDFAEYIFHRAQHTIPSLWSMHSFHHSDTTLNASSTNRHFWAEQAIKSVTVYLLPSILFKTNGTVFFMYAALSMYNIFIHMNIRIGFGKWSFLMNCPQYHRLHHSNQPEHYNCNFVALFPIFDVLFGTYHRPLTNEFPSTGIEGNDKPANIIEAVLWPARRAVRRAGRGWYAEG